MTLVRRSVNHLALAGAVTLAVLSLATLFPASGFNGEAQASTGYSCFCPSNPCASQGYKLVGGNDRCVSGHFNGVTRVQFYTKNGDGVSHCAGAKSNADGSGSNALPFTCTTAKAAITPLYSCRQGYATGLNQSASAHYFYGIANWNTACSV